jgi:hypothetical protein
MTERLQPASSGEGKTQHSGERPAQRARTDHQSDQQRPPLPDAPHLVAQLHDALTQLLGELAQGKSERLQQYLAFAARFHQYSRGNQWLILAQLPTATRVASYRKWQEEGYQVAKGVRSIRILAPSVRRIRPGPTARIPSTSADEVGNQNPDTRDVKTIVRFVAVSVFDVSQLTPEKRPPEFFTPLEGDADALYQRIVAAATADGFTVEQSEYTQGAEGFSVARRIVTRSNLVSTNRALTALHEYTHGLLHQGVHPLSQDERTQRNLTQISVPVKECHAEATAYIVAQHFGVQNPFSSDYLLHWGTTPETLRNELDVVLAAASHIISRVEQGEGEPQQQSPDPLAQV